MKQTIYKPIENIDHNPEVRSWYYDDFGNRIDKKTGDFVVLVTDKEDQPSEPVLLNESNNYDTKPCDTE